MAFDSTEVKWSDLKFYLNGTKVVKFTALKYKPEQEVEEIYGGGDEPLDLQTGNRKYSGMATMYKSMIDAMNKAARAQGFRDLMDVPWTIVADYKETLASPRTADTLPNVRFTDYEKGMEQNAKSMPITLNFKCLRPVEA